MKAFARPWWLACSICTVFALLVAGCSEAVHPSETRSCRILLAGLRGGPEGLSIQATGLRPLVLDNRDRGLDPDPSSHPSSGENPGSEALVDATTIVYRIRTEQGGRDHVIQCVFTPGQSLGARLPNLVAAALDGRLLGAERLYFARRFWLETPEAAGADPEPILDMTGAPVLPRPLAIALQTLVTALPNTLATVLMALALGLVHGLTNRTNLAFGEIAVMAGYGAALGIAGIGPIQSPGLAVAVGLAMAVWTAVSVTGTADRVIFEPLAIRPSQPALIASLGLSVSLGELVRLMQGNGHRTSPPLFDTPYALARAGDFVVTATPMLLVTLTVAGGLVIVLFRGMGRSRFGRRWRATADDPLSAALLGVDARRLALATFALAGLLAGVAGALSTLAAGGTASGTGLALGLKGVIAAILGGSGSLAGAALAATAMGLVEALWSATLPIEQRDLAIFTVIVLALILRPGGIAGQPALEPDHQRRR